MGHDLGQNNFRPHPHLTPEKMPQNLGSGFFFSPICPDDAPKFDTECSRMNDMFVVYCKFKRILYPVHPYTVYHHLYHF